MDIYGAEDLLGVEDGAEAPAPVETAPVVVAAVKPPVAAAESLAVPAQKPAAPATAPTPAPVRAAAPAAPAGQSPYDRIQALIPADSPLHGFSTLAEVEKWVANTELIELDRTRTRPVFGVGNPNADLLVIGEAPGADEDREGEPFVGRAGKLLTQILEAIGFARKDVYIANILKSRPDNNRDPRPELILCVGKTSGNSLLGGKNSLKSMRSQFLDFHGLEVLVTYHPAALLRNPNWKRPTWEDVQLLRTRYDELTGA